jgi:hypothetical protein
VKHLSPRRYSLFEPDTLLYRILSSPPGLRYAHPGHRKQIISRLAALMMINAALWEYRLSTERSEAFLDSLTTKLLDSEVDVSGSVEALLQILLACEDGYGADGQRKLSSPNENDPLPSARPWFVGRLLKIAKRLGRPSWDWLNDTLLEFLALTKKAPTVVLREDKLRQEILTAPLTSYIMPILQ